MNTDVKTEAKYTLIYYRPNGERYEGCGDYTRFDSEMECFAGVTREEMLKEIVAKTRHASSCCGSCPQSETECEFAILKDGVPLIAKGSNLGSTFYQEGVDETDDYYAVNNIFDEAAEIIEQEHKAKAEAEQKAKEEAAAKKAIADAEAARARQKAAEEAERKQYEMLKAKFEPKPEPIPEPLVKAVEKAKAELVPA
jgi:hypothetical protein